MHGFKFKCTQTSFMENVFYKMLLLLFYVAPNFVFICYSRGRHLAVEKKTHNETKKKIHPSIGPSACLYVSFLPLIAPVDLCPFSFSSVFTPTCSHSLIPPSSLFHLPSVSEAAAGKSVGYRG